MLDAPYLLDRSHLHTPGYVRRLPRTCAWAIPNGGCWISITSQEITSPRNHFPKKLRALWQLYRPDVSISSNLSSLYA